MSAKYCLPVPFFHFWPKVTHPAALSLCDSWGWATCLNLKRTQRTTCKRNRLWTRSVTCILTNHKTRTRWKFVFVVVYIWWWRRVWYFCFCKLSKKMSQLSVVSYGHWCLQTEFGEGVVGPAGWKWRDLYIGWFRGAGPRCT